MGLLDRIFGRRDRGRASAPPQGYPPQGYPDLGERAAPAPAPSDERAIERYRYLLRTAPPDQIEEAHAQAFAQLTPEQRRQVLEQLSAAVPEADRPRSDDPRTLARAATRAELRRPGILERAFGGYGPGYGPAYGPGYGPAYGPAYGGGYGPGFGSIVGGSLLGTVGGLVIGTAVADALFDTGPGDGGLFGAGDEYAEGFHDGVQADGGDYDRGDDYGAGDYGDGGGDYDGGDYADGGGDFGGDYGGGGDF